MVRDVHLAHSTGCPGDGDQRPRHRDGGAWQTAEHPDTQRLPCCSCCWTDCSHASALLSPVSLEPRPPGPSRAHRRQRTQTPLCSPRAPFAAVSPPCAWRARCPCPLTDGACSPLFYLRGNQGLRKWTWPAQRGETGTSGCRTCLSDCRCSAFQPNPLILKMCESQVCDHLSSDPLAIFLRDAIIVS